MNMILIGFILNGINHYNMKVYFIILTRKNCIGSLMVSVLASSAVDRVFMPWSGQTKDNKIGISCFSA